MHFDEKIEKISEGLNQHGIAYDQQRSNNKNSYKYTPNDSKNSFKKYGLPTIKAAKVNGAPFQSNGISDEENKLDNTEILIQGIGRVLARQIPDMIEERVEKMNKELKRGNYGAVGTLSHNVSVFSRTLFEYLEFGKHIYKDS